MVSQVLDRSISGLTQACECLQLPAGTRRAVLMSGMSTAEVMEVIGAYSDTGVTLVESRGTFGHLELVMRKFAHANFADAST